MRVFQTPFVTLSGKAANRVPARFRGGATVAIGEHVFHKPCGGAEK